MTSSVSRRPSTSSLSPLLPPSGPLPALPIPKTRRKLSEDAADGQESRVRSIASATSIPQARPPMRSATTSGIPTSRPTKSRSTPAVPTLNTASSIPSTSLSPSSPALPTPSKSLRKTTSIGAFPLPPKGTPRVTSLPPSPLSTSTSLSDIHAAQNPGAKRRDSSKHHSAESGVKKLKPRSSGYGVRSRGSASGLSGSPSLLNGTGDSNLVSSTSSPRLSLPSPPQSRSSSANGSYMTDGTTFEDVGDERGRPKSSDTPTADSKRDSGARSTKGNVLVSVRVRPDASSGETKSVEGEWLVDGRRSLIQYRGREGGEYRYDNVFSPHDQNSRVYDNAAKRLVRRVMEGYHGTVFAYGMTGTGKTFSMQGTATSPGVIPLAITDIFSYIRENPAREFLLRVSYLEIYNEKIFDLLSQSTPGQPQQEEIKLREDSKRGVYATPLKEEIVQSPNQLLRVISRGDLARRTSSTQFNARSSRSHAVVQIVVESRERTPSVAAMQLEGRKSDRILPGGVLVSTLSLIDLAGSEKAAESKERRTEGSHINKSLLTLGTVIGRLHGEDDAADGSKTAEKEKGLKHLPYRDSKLTRLLQPALSGNSLVSILCTIQLSSAGTSAAAAGSHTGETLNTLKFASRAKSNIVSHAKRNESNAGGDDAGSRALLDRYRLEIQDLRTQLEQQQSVKEEVEIRDEIARDRKVEEELERQERTRHEEQMLEMQLARTALKERISHLNRLILSSKSLGVNSGRFSSASMPLGALGGRMSVSSNYEFGRPVSRDSAMSASHHRDSAATLEVPMPGDASIGRAMSSGSITSGALPAAQISQMVIEDDDEDAITDHDVETPGLVTPGGDDDASLLQQNSMLQADLADKNRYIATLEKRLLMARRASHSRTSMHLAPPAASSQDDSHLENVVKERDHEIEELRAKLEDQMRMVAALRGAASKRDALDNADGATTASNGVARAGSRSSFRNSRAPHGSGMSHRSTPSTTSRSSGGGVVNFSHKTPLSPLAILNPNGDPMESRKYNAAASSSRRKSVDEMTMLLDQMIQEKVESGHVVQSEWGSLRVKRDTVMERIDGSDASGGVERDT